MKDRLGLRLAIIAALAAIALYANWDLFNQSFQYSPSATRLLVWQGEEEVRALKLREGLDLQGGLRVLLQARSGNPTVDQMQQAVTVIQKRVDALGVTEPQVQTQGLDKIVVELPGVTDPDRAVKTIGKTAQLEYIYSGSTPLTELSKVVTSYDGRPESLLHALPDDKKKPYQGPKPTEEPDLTAPVTPTVKAATGASSAITATGQTTTTAATTTIYPTVLTGKNIRNPQVQLDTLGNTVVSFEVDSEGANWLGDFTSAHLGEYMPIVLDGEVISSPVLNGAIRDSGQISGNFDQASAEDLVAQLRSGSLPVALDVVGQTQIGPTLGQQAIDAAVQGGLVGLAVVMIFMLLIYRLPGLLANLALTLYALFSLTIFRALPVTLTLAGIAGFVLSIGMAVDANILIFERMKEELRSGRSLKAAMDVGFARAWPSIRDSNTSTLITCVILFWFGNQFGASIVKGFAVTLAVGVLVSMFTAIFVTRTFMMALQQWVFGEASKTMSSAARLKTLFGF